MTIFPIFVTIRWFKNYYRYSYISIKNAVQGIKADKPLNAVLTTAKGTLWTLVHQVPRHETQVLKGRVFAVRSFDLKGKSTRIDSTQTKLR